MTNRPVEAFANRQRVAPALALVAINLAAGLLAAVALVRSDLLPVALLCHGAMMILAWGCLLPLGALVARYFKVTPGQSFPAVVDNPFWWNWHRGLQYAGVALATAALVVALRETGGRLATLHGRCGLVLMAFAWLQLASPLFRGSKGGPTGRDARPDDADTWRGDHFDMTLRRRLFEAWHKPVGWCLLGGAQVTILLGVDLAGSPASLICFLAAMMTALVLMALDSHLRGRWIDTHVALWGWGAASRAPDVITRDGLQR